MSTTQDYINVVANRMYRLWEKNGITSSQDHTVLPLLLNVLCDEDEEHRELISSFYRKGLDYRADL